MTTRRAQPEQPAGARLSAGNGASPSSLADAALVADLAKNALLKPDLRHVLEEAVHLVRERLSTEFVKVLELVPGREGFLMTAGVGWPAGYVGQVVVPLVSESQAGYTLQHGASVVVEDLRCETRFRGMPLLRDNGVVGSISTVLRGHSREHGIISAHTVSKRQWTAEDVSFLEQVAQIISAALDRDTTEVALRETNSRLELAMDAGRMGTWEWHIAAEKVIWSETLERIHGIAPGTFGGDFASYASDIHPEDRERVADTIQTSLQTGEHTLEYRIVRPDGGVRWLSARGTLVRDDQGEPVRMLGVCTDITDQKIAAVAAEEAEERYRALFENAAFGAFRTSLDGRFISANAALARILGYASPDELMDAVHAVGHDLHIDPLHRGQLVHALSEDDVVLGFEAQARRLNDGAPIWISITARAIRDDRGQLLSLEGVVEDVSERKGAERRLAVQYAVARILTDAPSVEAAVSGVLDAICDELGWSAGLMWAVDSHAGVLRFMDIHSVPSEDITTFAEMSRSMTFESGRGLPGRVWSAAEPAWIEALETDEDFPRIDAARRDGLVSAFAFPIVVDRAILGVLEFFSTSPQAPDAAIIAAARSVGNQMGQFIERKRAETERDSAQRYQAFVAEASTILSSSLDYEVTLSSLARLCVPFMGDWCSIDVLDDGALRRVSVAHSDPAREAMARRLQQEYPPEDHRTADTERVLRGESVLHPDIPDELIEASVQDPELLDIVRQLGLTSAIAVPLTARGRTAGILTLVSAESGRHYGRQDLRLAEDLGRRAGLAVDNAHLYSESQRILEELRLANEAKDEFLGLISHELRTPITTIFGGARVLRTRGDRIDAETRAGVLQDIEHESERLHRIVEDLLVLARLELGQPLATEPVLIQRIAEKTVNAVSRRNPRSIDLDVSKSLPAVRGSAVYLEQILRNLISNADKYSPAEAEIELTARLDGENVVTSVLDRGPGISASEMDLIFERFYRSSGTAKQAGGAGIGLTVCKRLVEAQNGAIWAETRDGGGLVVSFSLPLYADRD